MENQFKQVVQVELTIEQLRQLMKEEIKTVVDQFKKEESTKDLPEWLSQKEIASYYNVSRQTVGNWESQGLITRKLIGGIPKFSKEQVLNLQK
jgi:DNA-binding transcriptional regulator YiaG